MSNTLLASAPSIQAQTCGTGIPCQVFPSLFGHNPSESAELVTIENMTSGAWSDPAFHYAAQSQRPPEERSCFAKCPAKQRPVHSTGLLGISRTDSREGPFLFGARGFNGGRSGHFSVGGAVDDACCAVLHTSPWNPFHPSDQGQIVGLAFVFIVALIMGKREERRIRNAHLTDCIAEAAPEMEALRCLPIEVPTLGKFALV